MSIDNPDFGEEGSQSAALALPLSRGFAEFRPVEENLRPRLDLLPDLLPQSCEELADRPVEYDLKSQCGLQARLLQVLLVSRDARAPVGAHKESHLALRKAEPPAVRSKMVMW